MRLQEANERLQELDRLKDDFVSTVSHELRTPLTSIRAFSEILLDNPDLDEERAAGLPADRRRGDRAADPADQPGARPVQARVRPNRLAHRARRPAQTSSTTSAQATAQLFRDTDDPRWSCRRRVRAGGGADRDRVVQVVVNLLSNAVKFSEPGTGRVRVWVWAPRTAPCGSTCRTTVPASPSQDQQVIFEKFRQGGDTRTEPPGGHRSGAADQPGDHRPSRRAALGGQQPGEGATFSFTLPMATVGSVAIGAETEG